MMRKLFKLPRGRLDRTVWGGEKWQWLETCPERLPDMKIDFCLHPASKPCPRCLGNALPGGCHQLSKELAKSRGSWIDPKSDNLHHGMAGAPKNFRSAQVSLSFDSALSLILWFFSPSLAVPQQLWAAASLSNSSWVSFGCVDYKKKPVHKLHLQAAILEILNHVKCMNGVLQGNAAVSVLQVNPGHKDIQY